MSSMPRKLAVLSCLFVVAALGLTLPSRARQDGQAPIQVDVNLVLLDATVKNKAGEIMTSLKKDDFQVREDGAVQKLDVFSRDELPLDVALVLDLSDSIGPFLDPLRDAANLALGALKPDDQVALFTFATDAQLRTPLTKDKKKVADQISSFEARGATNINDGIFVAAQYLLQTPPTGRRVIILISDDVGTSAGGQGTRDIVTETIAADCVLYNLKIPGYNPASTLAAASMVPGLVDIKKVADQTGGEIFDVKDVARLDSTFQAMIARIKTRYTLGYYTHASGAEGKPHKLDVVLAPSFGKKGRDYTILSKTAYYIR